MMGITYDSLFAANPLCKNHDGITEAKSELSSTALGVLTQTERDCNKLKKWKQNIRESAATNTVGKTMDGESGAFAEAIEAMCTLRSPCMHIQRIC